MIFKFKSVVVGFVLSFAVTAQAQTQEVNRLCGLAPDDVVSARELLHPMNFVMDQSVIEQAGWGRYDRVQMACEMRNAFLSKYALVGSKRERLRLDVKAHMDQCVITEAKTHGASSLSFLDRMQKCIAGLQDTHVALTPIIPRPTVFTAIEMREVEGRFVVSRRSESMIRLLAPERGFENIDKELIVGAEITKIEGVDVATFVQNYEPYISASWDEGRREGAVYAVFRRNFLYPAQPNVRVRLASGREYTLPWLHTDERRMDATMTLKNSGVNNARSVIEGSKFEWSGYNASAPLISGNEILSTWNDDAGWVGLRLGIVDGSKSPVGRGPTTQGKSYCYIQLLTFTTTGWKQSGKDEKVGFLEPMRDLLQTCERQSLPLVLDLRNNPGGNASFPNQVLSLLTEPGKTYEGRMMGFRANRHSLWLLSRHMEDPRLIQESFGDFSETDLMLKAINDGVRDGREHTDLIRSTQVKADEVVKGYSQKVVALVSPQCVSACDITAALLKRSGRAVLIGTPTSGTGAGFYQWHENGPDAVWKTSAHEAFKVRIPNFLFGVPTRSSSNSLLPYEQFKQDLMENKPTFPDVRYRLTKAELEGREAGWRQVAERMLFQ